jgi:hypothetical protein
MEPTDLRRSQVVDRGSYLQHQPVLLRSQLQQTHQQQLCLFRMFFKTIVREQIPNSSKFIDVLSFLRAVCSHHKSLQPHQLIYYLPTF